MKILVTGSEGQLGRELIGYLPGRGHEVIALSRLELDVADSRAVKQVVEAHSPELVINAAAYTNVDACETETGTAYAVNALGPRNLAQSCERRGCELLHVSTNYVFDGTLKRPYEPFDPPNPISAYGISKLAGERYVEHLSTRWYVVRSAGIYGRGRNFVRTMLRLAGERDEVRVKDDEFISPTYARDLAEGIANIVESGHYGLYHTTNSGSCSWYEFAREIFDLAGVEIEVVPVPGSEYPLPAARPANGVLSTLGNPLEGSSGGGPRLRHWREALAEYLKQETGTALR